MAKSGSSSNSGDNGINMFIIGIIVVLVLFILGFVVYKYLSGGDNQQGNTIVKLFGGGGSGEKNSGDKK